MHHLATGIFMWNADERRTDRYGAFYAATESYEGAKPSVPVVYHETAIAALSDKRVFFSYSTPVAAIMDGIGIGVRTDAYHSVTTSRHVNTWLRANGYGDSKVTKPQAWFDALKG